MATPMHPILRIVKPVVRYAGMATLGLEVFFLLYLGLSWGLSRIPVAAENTEGQAIEVFILTNGVHTDIVMPARHPLMDWTREIRYEHTVSGDTTLPWIALGWGHRGFYLDIPTWSDLTLGLALNAALGLGTTAIHATFHHTPQTGPDCRKLSLSETQYRRLTRYILASFALDARGHAVLIRTNAQYGTNDAFYEAKGAYSLFRTCNTWANAGLKSAGQRAALWTPFQQGIFRHYPW